MHLSVRERKKESSTRTTAQPSNNDLIDNMDKLDEKNDRKDYDDLLKRLEKPSSKVHGSPTGIKFANDSSRMQVSTQKDDLHKGGGTDASDIGGLLQSGSVGPTVSLSDQMALKQKSKRRLNSSIGGPVISSGLGAKRDSRPRHSTGRLSGSLTAKNIGSLFGDDEDSKELSSVHVHVSTPNQGPLVNKVRSFLQCISDAVYVHHYRPFVCYEMEGWGGGGGWDLRGDREKIWL